MPSELAVRLTNQTAVPSPAVQICDGVTSQARPGSVHAQREGDSAAAEGPSRRTALAMGAAAAGVVLPGLANVSPAAATSAAASVGGDAALCRTAAAGARASVRSPVPIAQLAEGSLEARAADTIRVGQSGTAPRAYTDASYVHVFESVLDQTESCAAACSCRCGTTTSSCHTACRGNASLHWR